MLIDDFNKTINIWIQTIQHYNFKQLCAQPGEESWSLGQVCIHLLNDTNWFIEQVKICKLNDDNANETMSFSACIMFANNSFPNEKLTNPFNANMLQPSDQNILLESFIQLKNDMNNVAKEISKSQGKTKHPGLGYFNAIDWLQFAEMHLRHHLNQKKNIEELLNSSV